MVIGSLGEYSTAPGHYGMIPEAFYAAKVEARWKRSDTVARRSLETDRAKVIEGLLR